VLHMPWCDEMTKCNKARCGCLYASHPGLADDLKTCEDNPTDYNNACNEQFEFQSVAASGCRFMLMQQAQ
jgi:hypothetical protein